MNLKDFGLRLKKMRIKHNLTQSQLASKIGTSRQAYINYETGRCMPPAEVIANMSKVYNVDLMELLFEHKSISLYEAKAHMSNLQLDEFFSMMELYSKLTPQAKKRLLTLMSLMQKGGDK